MKAYFADDGIVEASVPTGAGRDRTSLTIAAY
jgi:hypothetical protein